MIELNVFKGIIWSALILMLGTRMDFNHSHRS